MEKKDYLLISGIIFLILSIIFFNFWREEIVPPCLNSVTCNLVTSYFEAYTKLGGFTCADYCRPNINKISFNVPNQLFLTLIKIGLFFIILWFSIKVVYLIKIFIRKIKDN